MPAVTSGLRPVTTDPAVDVSKFHLNFQAELIGTPEKVSGVAQYNFKVEFNPTGAKGLDLSQRQITELPVQADSMENALKILHGLGSHFKRVKDPTEFHGLMGKLKTGCTKITIEDKGANSYDLHFHELNAAGTSYKSDARPVVRVTAQEHKEIREYAALIDVPPIEMDAAEDDFEPHVKMTKRLASQGTAARVKLTRTGAPVTTRPTTNPNARHKKGSREFGQYLAGVKHLAQRDGHVSFYRGDLGATIDKAQGNDPRTDVFGNFYECAESFNVTCYYDDGTGEKATDLAFTNTEAFFQSQRFKSLEVQKMFQGLTGAQAVELKSDLLSGRKKINGKKAETFADWSANHTEGQHMENRNAKAMLRGLEAKFADKTQEGAALLATGGARLVEHNPTKGRDTIWSDDSDGAGLNLLGRMLECRREALGREKKGVTEAVDYSNLAPKARTTYSRFNLTS